MERYEMLPEVGILDRKESSRSGDCIGDPIGRPASKMLGSALADWFVKRDIA